MSSTSHLELLVELAELDPADLSQPADRHVVVGGLRLHYLDWGGQGREVVFLHGGALTAHTWDAVCLELRGEYRCLAVDQRGHGDSEWAPGMEYGTEHHERDLSGFLDHLDSQRPVLVGQSMGALNALSYAMHTPSHPAGLVLVDFAPCVSQDGTERIADFVLAPAELGSVDEFVERAQAFNPARDQRLLRASLLHNLRELPDGRWTWKYDRRHLSRDLIDDLRTSLSGLVDDLAAVTCPTLVVRGARSDVLDEADAVAFAAALPNGRAATVADAAHTVQGDNPRGLTKVLRSFLGELEP